jgi:hypothetical protein
MAFGASTKVVWAVTRAKFAGPAHLAIQGGSALLGAAVFLDRHSSRRDDVYNILWAVVFGFATLNILTLAARRFESNRRGLSFGELMAVLIVLISIFLLGWEMLGIFHIFPIKIQR